MVVRVFQPKESPLLTSVVDLLNESMQRISEQGDFRCSLCHERNDAHSIACPVPLLEDWLAMQ